LMSHALNPDNIVLLIAVSEQGSLAAAARTLGLVPSALTYRVRKLEEQLDVLLVDRSSRNGTLTEAGKALVHEGRRLLSDADAVARRVKRIADGWEPRLTIAVDSIISRSIVLELCDRFYKPFGSQASCPTQIRLRGETLSGTWETLLNGEADLALGVVVDGATATGLLSAPLGEVPFVFAVSPHHPLAALDGPLKDAQIKEHRAIAVADSARRLQPLTIGLLEGQDVLTVSDMSFKLDAQLRGIGCGFLPYTMAASYLECGRLVEKRTQRRARVSRVSYAWRANEERSVAKQGLALTWWLDQLALPKTRAALLGNRK
jgi:molybdate transport repressor ModE-like protein